MAYFIFLSWQLLTPVTIVQAGGYDKLIHFGAFGLLALLAALSLQRRPIMMAMVTLIVYAAFTEIIQHFIPGRSFSVLDWLADGLGIMAASLVYKVFFKAS